MSNLRCCQWYALATALRSAPQEVLRLGNVGCILFRFSSDRSCPDCPVIHAGCAFQILLALDLQFKRDVRFDDAAKRWRAVTPHINYAHSNRVRVSFGEEEEVVRPANSLFTIIAVARKRSNHENHAVCGVCALLDSANLARAIVLKVDPAKIAVFFIAQSELRDGHVQLARNETTE